MEDSPPLEPGWSPPLPLPRSQPAVDADVPRRPSRKRTPALVAAGAVVVLLVAAAVAVFGSEPDPTPTATSPSSEPAADPDPTPVGTTPTLPDSATVPVDDDMRAEFAALQAYVALARDLPFRRNVDVQLVADAAFEVLIDEIFAIEASDLAATAAYYEALGLIPEGTAATYALELRERYRSVLGFYDPDSGMLVVRGGELNGGVRAVIVHELVHALDDQWFDMSRPEYEQDASTERATSFPMVIEGDAERIENQWIDEQPPDVQEEAREHVGHNPGGLADHTEFIDYGFLAPYEAGLSFIVWVAERDGERLVDAVLLDPPDTTEQVMFPEVFERREGRVPVPRPPANGPIVDEGVTGALFWAGLLGFGGSGVPQDTADAAVHGWGGDWSVTWTEGDGVCTRTDAVGDTTADTAELLAALTQWAVERPQVSVTEADGRARMEVCYQIPGSGSSV